MNAISLLEMASPCLPRRTIPRGLFLRRPAANLLILVLSLVAAHPILARKAPPIGSHIPPGERPAWIARAVWEQLFAGITPSGKHLSAQELKPLVVSAQWPPAFWTRTGWHLKIGVFLLAVRADGTVAHIEILQSTGARFIDRDVSKAFAKWRFRPNSVKEVRVPAYYAFE